MAILYICDGCGQQEKAWVSPSGRKLIKPHPWYARADEDGEQHACSRECIEKIAHNTGKTSVVLPW